MLEAVACEIQVAEGLQLREPLGQRLEPIRAKAELVEACALLQWRWHLFQGCEAQVEAAHGAQSSLALEKISGGDRPSQLLAALVRPRTLAPT